MTGHEMDSVGYIVLIGDLIPPVLCFAFDWTLSEHLRSIIVIVCLASKCYHRIICLTILSLTEYTYFYARCCLYIVVYPLCCFDNLSGLKYTCVFSFCSVIVLAICVGQYCHISFQSLARLTHIDCILW
jgi:amino acid permease